MLHIPTEWALVLPMLLLAIIALANKFELIVTPKRYREDVKMLNADITNLKQFVDIRIKEHSSNCRNIELVNKDIAFIKDNMEEIKTLIKEQDKKFDQVILNFNSGEHGI